MNPDAGAQPQAMAPAAAGLPWAPRPWRLRGLRRDTADVFTLELEAPPGDAGTPIAPGQFNMLYRFGLGEAAISVSGRTAAGALQHTIRAVGSVTRQLATLAPGAVVGVRGPFGNGWPLDALRGHDIVIVGGGIGFAPLRPLVERLLQDRPDFGRIDILYGARRPDDLLYAPDFERWRGQPGVRVHITVDNGSAAWHGEIGAVTHLIPGLGLDPGKTLALICGPEVMMRFTVLALQQEGLPAEAMYLSMERHMQCAVGYCGHCFYGPHFVCRDGPVFRLDRLHGRLAVPEL